MAQNKAIRLNGPAIQFISASSQYFDVPRFGVLYQMLLRIAFTVTTGGVLPVGPVKNWHAAIIRNLSLIINSKDTPINCPGPVLAEKCFEDFKRLPYGMGQALPSVINTGYNYVIYLPVTLYLPNAKRVDDCGLNLGTPRIAGVPAQVKIDWANTNCADFYATPNGAVLSNVSCEMSGFYETDPDPMFFPELNTKGEIQKQPRYWMQRVLDYREYEVVANSTKFPITIDERTGTFYRSIHLRTLADGAGSDAIFANGKMELAVGPDSYGQINAGHLKAWAAEMFTPNDPPVGDYMLPFDLFASMGTAINTQNLAADLILNAEVVKTGTVCKIGLTREGIRPLSL